MRLRVAFISLALVATAVALPLGAHAQAIPFLGPILDTELMQTCALGWGSVLVVVNNIIRLLLTLLIVFVAPLMFAYAGFLLVVNSVNPHGKEEARRMIQNLVVGLVVAFAAWLIVDLIMSVLYNPNAQGLGVRWYEIITTGGADLCIPLAGHLTPAPSQNGLQGAGAGTQGNPVLCSSSNTACSSATLASFGLSTTQADAMSCIAMTESAGGTNVDNGNGTGCNNFGFCGMYQLSPTLIAQFAPPDCTREEIIANSDSCNARTAVSVIQSHGYSDWTGGGQTPWNPKARSCVLKYDSGTSKPGFVVLLREVYDRLVAYVQHHI